MLRVKKFRHESCVQEFVVVVGLEGISRQPEYLVSLANRIVARHAVLVCVQRKRLVAGSGHQSIVHRFFFRLVSITGSSGGGGQIERNSHSPRPVRIYHQNAKLRVERGAIAFRSIRSIGTAERNRATVCFESWLFSTSGTTLHRSDVASIAIQSTIDRSNRLRTKSNDSQRKRSHRVRHTDGETRSAFVLDRHSLESDAEFGRRSREKCVVRRFHCRRTMTSSRLD